MTNNIYIYPHRFIHNCIYIVLYCIVFLHMVFCTLYGYSATLAARLLNKLDLT